jgi:hypothetical protein
MKKIKLFLLITPALIFSFAACGNGGGGDKDEDVDVDVPHDPVQDEVIIDVPPEEIPSDPVTEDIPIDPAVEEVAPDLPVDVPEEEEGIPGNCGNGTAEDGEVCDDGNTVTEHCGGAGDCLGDCSMAIETCGNGSADLGEECDDGDTDSMNDCTTSCNTNDHGIGAPCICEGRDCSDTNFSAGDIVGCENVVIPEGSGGVLACMRSIHETISDYMTFFAGGMCTIMALECEGTMCMFVSEFGDLDTFECPAGYVVHEDVRIIMGSTITSKLCMKTCDSPADCRWNEYDDFWDECGEWDCVPSTDDPGTRVCSDMRME